MLVYFMYDNSDVLFGIFDDIDKFLSRSKVDLKTLALSEELIVDTVVSSDSDVGLRSDHFRDRCRTLLHLFTHILIVL